MDLWVEFERELFEGRQLLNNVFLAVLADELVGFRIKGPIKAREKDLRLVQDVEIQKDGNLSDMILGSVSPKGAHGNEEGVRLAL